MRGSKAGPPRPPRGDEKVISIVEELERRQMARVRDRASAMHLRELESSLELIDHTAALKDMDLEAELAKVANPTTEEAKRERAHIRAARALQSCLRGNPEAGMAEWAEVIAEMPELAHTYLVRARWLMQVDPTAAIADYDRAATMEPKNPTVYCRRGDCYASLGDADRALANYRRALALDPSLFDVHHSMAKIFSGRGEHAAAAGAYGHAIALAPRYADFYLGRAQALERVGDYEGALRDHARILELDPSRNDVRFYRVICLHRAGHAERAIEDMLRLIEIEPGDHHNYRILGKMRIESGQQQQAVADLTRSIELSPDPLTFAHRGRAHWELGERELSLADFEEAVAGKPDEPEFYLGRAKALASLDRVPEAMASVSRAIELAPGHAFAHVMRAIYRQHVEGDAGFDAVRADLDRAVELDPESVGFRRQRGEYLMDYGKNVAALVDFEKALALLAARPDPQPPAPAHTPGEAFLLWGRGYCKSRLDEELGEIDEDYWEEDEDIRARCLSAIADLERAIELGLRNEDVYSELWNAWCQIRDDEKQGEALDRACAAVPDSAMLFYVRHGHRRRRGDLEGAAADKAKAIENGWQWRDD